MEELPAVLHRHAALYRGMEAQDYIKLVYQNEFGAEHLLQNAGQFETRLEAERRFALQRPLPLTATDEIGNGVVRAHLACLPATLSARTFAALCLHFAKGHKGNKGDYTNKLQYLRGMIQQGQLPLHSQSAMELLSNYNINSCSPPRHSARYLALYHPHYRLLSKGATGFLPVFAAVDASLGQKPHVLVGVEGMSGAGKSGLARLLEEVYGCRTVHTDDFFLQAHQRTAQRLALPGGNIDYERLAVVAKTAGAPQAFKYAPYNCATGTLNAAVALPRNRLTVIEGVYAMHPHVQAAYDVRVFLYTDAATQHSRIAKRSGQALAERYVKEWIPMENHYFAAFDVRQMCDVAVDTTLLYP